MELNHLANTVPMLSGGGNVMQVCLLDKILKEKLPQSAHKQL